MKVAIRADASETIGTGHLMRCLTLADGLRHKGAQTRFLCRSLPEHLIGVLEGRGHGLQQVTASEHDSLFRAHLSNEPCDWLIIDHYDLDAEWERSVRPFTKGIMVIDDLANRSHDCNILLDQNYRVTDDHRYAGMVPQSCLLRMGPKYALLQSDYAQLHQEVKRRESVNRLLIYFGGADGEDLTGRSLRAALSLELPSLEIDVVLSSGSPNSEKNIELARRHENVHCHHGLPSLAPLIAKADLSIGAMGATSWERLCLGLPTIGVTLADNQVEIANALHQQKLVIWLGDKGDVRESDLADCLRQTIDSTGLSDWSGRCMELCDGQGTGRIVSNLISLSRSTLSGTDAGPLEGKN